MAELTGVCYVAGAMPIDAALCPRPASGDFVIAADRGYETLTALGVLPDLVVGDFDSLGYAPRHPCVISLPAAKDDTDTLFALRQGLERGYRRFVLLGCAGGRLEHTLASLQALDFLAERGAAGVLAGEGAAAAALRDGTLAFPPVLRGYLSVFCWSGTAEGVTLRGLKFPLENAVLSGSYPIGVSNEFLGERAEVTVRRGSLLLVWGETGERFYSLLPSLWPRRL